MYKSGEIETAGKAKHSMILPWLIWAASASFVLFQFFLQLSSGVIVEDLMRSFAINAIGAGILSSTYYYVYVTLQTPAGILVDRYGPRKLLAGGGIVCAVGCFIFATSSHLAMAELGRLLMGAGSSFAFVSSLFLISQWFPLEKFALMVGIAETVGTVGTLFGNIFLATLLNDFGWRQCMGGAAILAIFIGLACWLIIRDKPPGKSENIVHADVHFLEHAIQLLKNPIAWLNGLYSGLLFSVVTVFVALWGIPFLVKSHNISITVATMVSSSVFLGLAIGCPIVGTVYNSIKHINHVMALCALAMALLLIIVLLATTLSIFVVSGLMFLIGLLCSIYVINFAIAKEIAPPEATSTSVGFTNTLSVITAPLMQPIVGALLHFIHSLEKPATGQPEMYTVFDYQVALMILPVGLVVAAVIAEYLDVRGR